MHNQRQGHDENLRNHTGYAKTEKAGGKDK
jgi:hypothetical protein